MFTGMMVTAQEPNIWWELDEWWHYPGPLGSDSLYVYHYNYNNGDSLSSINKWDFWKSGDYRWGYKGDKCLKITGDDVVLLEYFDDSVVRLKSDGSVSEIFYTDSNYRVYRLKKIKTNYTLTFDFTWENENIVEVYDGTTTYSCEYFSEYINPWYQENRFLRSYAKRGFTSGSYNLLKTIHFGPGTDVNFEVIESDGPFPIKVTENGSQSYHFYYRNTLTGIPNLSSDPQTVLSVGFYDLMGRKISKPVQGFYIERKTTDKGVISTKYFIQ